MIFLTKKLYKWQLSSLLSKMCESSIPLTGDSRARVNCFEIALDKDSKPYFFVRGVEGDNLTGMLWDGTSYSTEAKIPIETIVAHDLFITHYYGHDEIKYRGIYDFIINNITRWIYIKMYIEKLDQYFFNKKKLVTKERMDLLKLMLSDQFERSHSGISIIDLMTKLYSIKWVLHPKSDVQEKKLELYLDSLVKSGDIKKINHEYEVTGTAISSIEKFEEEERRHVENVKMQKRALWLTIIIAIAALIQAGVIKLPTLIDLSAKTHNEQVQHSR